MHTNSKGQALTNFLLEILEEGKNTTQAKKLTEADESKDHQRWTWYADGATSKERSGAGMILTSPEGEEISYAICFDFHTSNNEVEYEALLVGLRLAKKMGAQAIVDLTDSRLAANQINGDFEVKGKRMEKYVKIV